jgi:acyl carrier protein
MNDVTLIPLEEEIKELIVEALMLDDVAPKSIDSEAPLFGDGLGLDSIDALELAIAIDRKYKVKIRAEDENSRGIFRSVRTLATHVASELKGAERAGGAPA